MTTPAAWEEYQRAIDVLERMGLKSASQGYNLFASQGDLASVLRKNLARFDINGSTKAILSTDENWALASAIFAQCDEIIDTGLIAPGQDWIFELKTRAYELGVKVATQAAHEQFTYKGVDATTLKMIRKAGLEQIVGIGEDQKQLIRDTLTKATYENRTIFDTMDSLIRDGRVPALMIEDKNGVRRLVDMEVRIENITRTETSRIAEQGSFDKSLEIYGDDMDGRWNGIDDGRERASHLLRNGKVRSARDWRYVPFPADGRIIIAGYEPRCRCWMEWREKGGFDPGGGAVQKAMKENPPKVAKPKAVKAPKAKGSGAPALAPPKLEKLDIPAVTTHKQAEAVFAKERVDIALPSAKARELTEAEIQKLAEDIRRMPRAAMRAIQEDKQYRTFIFGNGDGVCIHPDNYHLAKLHPRGYPAGTTYKSALGCADTVTRRSYVDIKTYQEWKGKNRSTVIHEWGHNLDRRLSGKFPIEFDAQGFKQLEGAFGTLADKDFGRTFVSYRSKFKGIWSKNKREYKKTWNAFREASDEMNAIFKEERLAYFKSKGIVNPSWEQMADASTFVDANQSSALKAVVKKYDALKDKINKDILGDPYFSKNPEEYFAETWLQYCYSAEEKARLPRNVLDFFDDVMRRLEAEGL